MSTDQDRTVVQLLDFHPASSRTMDIFLLRVAETLRDRGWRTVHIFSGDPPEPFRARLQAIDSVYHLSDFPINWRCAKRLAGLIRPYRPQIIQTTFMSAFDAPLWWLKRASHARYWVVADHSSGACSPKNAVKKLAARARGAMADWVIDRVVAVSDYVARRDIEDNGLPPGKVRTIYNGVDVERFHPDGNHSAKNGAVTIVFAGQLIPEKGVDLLIQALRRVSDGTEQPLRLKIAGKGHQRSALEQLASELLPGKVEFVGQVEDVPALFRSADLAVFPSRWEEAFGLVVAEAMACGTPVIASDAGGIPEVIGRDGRHGLVFRNGDVEDLERQIRVLLAAPELRLRMSRAARERTEREFSITRMVDEYVSLYEELAPRTGG